MARRRCIRPSLPPLQQHPLPPCRRVPVLATMPPAALIDAYFMALPSKLEGPFLPDEPQGQAAVGKTVPQTSIAKPWRKAQSALPAASSQSPSPSGNRAGVGVAATAGQMGRCTIHTHQHLAAAAAVHSAAALQAQAERAANKAE